MYLISIYFDEQTEKRLQEFICHVAKATGNSFMLEHQVPPHMTVAAVETRNEDVLLAQVEEIATKELESGEIRFVSVGSFSSQVMFVQPVLDEYLHNMSSVLADKFAQMSETKTSSLYEPFSWLPHCTIGKQLTKEQMTQAFQVLQDCFAPINGRVVRIGVAKTNPHRDVKVWELET